MCFLPSNLPHLNFLLLWEYPAVTIGAKATTSYMCGNSSHKGFLQNNHPEFTSLIPSNHPLGHFPIMLTTEPRNLGRIRRWFPTTALQRYRLRAKGEEQVRRAVKVLCHRHFGLQELKAMGCYGGQKDRNLVFRKKMMKSEHSSKTRKAR